MQKLKHLYKPMRHLYQIHAEELSINVVQTFTPIAVDKDLQIHTVLGF